MTQERTSLFSRLFSKSDASSLSRSAAETVALWRAFEALQGHLRAVVEASSFLVPKLARLATVVESSAERARTGRARSLEFRDGLARVSQVLDRLDVVALNVALEGARLGDARGQSLSLVADEVKGHLVRGRASIEELSRALEEGERDLTRWDADVSLAERMATETGLHSARIQDAARSSLERGDEIASKLRVATGSDAETSQALAAAVDHARALAESLGALVGRVPRALLVATLRPVLEPLFGMVDDEPRDADGG